MSRLLTRDEFRAAVLRRDGGRCVVCGARESEALGIRLDAHHIMERRLFRDEGYYEDNGATMCDVGPSGCHYKAEQTLIAVEDLLARIGAKARVTPEHLYRDQAYTKWGDPILPNGTRLRGELFQDESVQKVLASGGVLHLYTKYVKYPRTFHLPWSPNVTDDDRMLPNDRIFYEYADALMASKKPHQVVVTLKMDGENTTWYRDYMHARSLEYEPHPSRDRVKAMWAERCYDIPDGWRLCGENLYALHSVLYDDLPSYFMVFSLWNDKNECMPWAETEEWAALLGLPTVPVIYRGSYSEEAVEAAFAPHRERHEGYVVRLANRFHYRDFQLSVGKWVRKGHLQTHGGWMRQQLTPNQLARTP